MKAIYAFLVSHGTKVLGFMQVTVGVIAGATDIISPNMIKWFVVANGLLVAWRGFFNSAQSEP